MARPKKQGLDYFPMDVNFFNDIKIRKVIRKCGAISTTVLLNLLTLIYREEGYYTDWNDDMLFYVSDTLGIDEDTIKATIEVAVEVNFFNKNKFEEHKILTSEGIQERFFSITTRRKNIKVNNDYCLFNGVNVNNNSVNVSNNSVNVSNNSTEVHINGVNVSKSTQRKGKESKVKESKLNNICVENDTTHVEEIINHLNEKLGTRYTATSKTTKSHINARLKEGYTVDDFKAVIDSRYKLWKGTKFEEYLRPQTIFSPKFEGYLQTAQLEEEEKGEWGECV